MIHIRSSIKGVFLLENEGVPVSSTTDFNEPIVRGSLCVDTLVGKLYTFDGTQWNAVGSDIDISYIRPNPTVISVGGISAGTIPNYNSMGEVFDAMFYPFQQPSVAISGGGLYEKGIVITGSYPYSITLRDGIVDIRDIQLNGVSVSTPISNNGTYVGIDNLEWSNSPNNASTYWRHTYSYVVTFTNTTVKTSSTNIEFASPTYYGVLNIADVNEANIKGLTKRVRKKSNDDNLSFNPILKRYVYAYPSSYGDLSNIIDPNGFNVTASFNKSVINFTLADGSIENYNVYVSNSDTTQTNFLIDFQF